MESITAGALAGVRVVDVTQVMAGPFCTMLLADLGADVVKIEPPAGDMTRRMPGGVGTDTPAFNAVNRGKRSVVLDLKTGAGRDAALRLVDSADVFAENSRPGVMADLGLDYPTLAARNRGLVYASISGYGQTGPDRGKGGLDLIAQGVSGIMSVTGEADGPPVKSGVPLTDLGAALFAVTAVLAALVHRNRTGAGQHVETSLVEAGVALSVWEATEYFAGGLPGPLGSAHRMVAPYQAVQCADGYVTIGASTDRLFERLCDALSHPEWARMPEFADNPSRVRNRAALAGRIESVMRTQGKRHWLDAFESRDIPCGPINSYAEVFADPQIVAREMVVDVTHPTLGDLRAIGSPMKLSATPATVRRRAPRLGEHTEDVLREAGLSAAAIADLVSAAAHRAARPTQSPARR
ncbi:MAG: CoA transferase [Acidobacteria bacterium]|nr:CoA transferase [Acidobacteriota bacterium]